MYEILGQKKLLRRLDDITLSHFTIIHGEVGAGKHYISQYLADKKNIDFVDVGSKIDNIRKLIADVIAYPWPRIYYINGDNLTLQAQNALLKLCEEPPTGCYIIIGSSKPNILPTITSRAKALYMNPYSYNELVDYYEYKYKDEVQDVKLLCSVARTPGMIDTCINYGFNNIAKYAHKVYENILKVTTGNSFKIGNEISFKEGEKGYPIDIFLSVFKEVILQYFREDIEINRKMLMYTNIAVRDLGVTGANKKLIFDIWVLNIRSLR